MAVRKARASDRARLVGREGEDLAAAWYETNGFEVLARNWRCRAGEIDLVCRRGTTVVMCEVKARRSDSFGMGIEAVTRTKQQRLRRLAAMWLANSKVGCKVVRFDVATIDRGLIQVFEGAF